MPWNYVKPTLFYHKRTSIKLLDDGTNTFMRTQELEKKIHNSDSEVKMRLTGGKKVDSKNNSDNMSMWFISI